MQMPDTSLQGAVSGPLQATLREAERALSVKDYRKAHELCTRVLTADPASAGAMFLFGMIAAEHGNFRKASEVIQRAVDLDSTRAEYHAHLGRCLIALLRRSDAMQAAQRALELDPKDALTLDTIGVVLTRVGEHERAIEPFRRAVARDPNKPAFWYNLAAALQFVGDFAGADEAYKRSLKLDSGFYRAWSSLAQLRRAPFDAMALAVLEAGLANAEEQGGQQEASLHLGHALAKHYEDIGQHKKSFGFLQRAKRSKHESLKYSSATDQKLFDAVITVCSPSFLHPSEGGKNEGSPSTEPIFIVGMPRTGTTLIERIVSNHPDVFSAGELTNFSLTVKRKTNTSSNLVLDVETMQAAKCIDWQSIGDEYVASTRPQTGHTKHFIDKMPLNFLYAGFIAKALPNAKIICVRRNPVDTCLSNYRQLFATQFPYYNYSYDLLDTGRYYIMFDALIRYWREHIPRNFIEVEYEAVVADTETQARRLIEFCGLEWNDTCLNFHENAAPVSTASSVQVRQPIYKTSVERWRKYEKETAELRLLLTDAGLHI
jgi:tetratricopeptide (TPR) repeat protein